MLTVNDRTVPEPVGLLTNLMGPQVQAVGIKEVGVAPDRLADILIELNRLVDQVYLEIMTNDSDSCLQYVEIAARLKIAGVLGTRSTPEILTAVRTSKISYYPILDDVAAYSRTSEGDISVISKLARRSASEEHVTGLLLNPYRIGCNPRLLTEAVKAAAMKPVFATGSINSISRIRTLCNSGVDYMGIGSSIIDCSLVAGTIQDQMHAARQAICADNDNIY